MDSRHLTPAQANSLRQILGRHLRFLARLCTRMERLGFPGNDPLYVAAAKAQRALQELHVRAHYCSCTSGVAKPTLPPGTPRPTKATPGHSI